MSGTIIRFEPSERKGKKYMATVFKDGKKIKTTHFGQLPYEHYKDSTPGGNYKHLDHNDNERRELFRKRFKSPGPKYSPLWFSWHYLW